MPPAEESDPRDGLLAPGVGARPGSVAPGLAALDNGQPGDLGGTALAAAVAEGMSAPPEDAGGTAPGLAALRAMTDMAAGAEGDLRRVTRGLSRLRAAGFGAAARGAAIDLLLAERAT